MNNSIHQFAEVEIPKLEQIEKISFRIHPVFLNASSRCAGF